MSGSAAQTPKMEDEEFIEIVRRTPLISIDLIIRDQTDRILLGLRKNAPAQGTWFVPGGIIRKDETLAKAFARISEDELGQSLALDDAAFIGVFEHFYDENRSHIPGISTHYVVLAFTAKWLANDDRLPCDQHEEFHWFSETEANDNTMVHSYTKAYLRPTDKSG